MIGRLTGAIVRSNPTEIVVEVGGVGFRVFVPLSTFCALPTGGGPVTLEIHTLVRDDAIALYGFLTESEKAVFEALLSVSGVGPKVALALLSGLSPGEVVRSVGNEDPVRLRSVPGVGKKLADRIVLELRERVSKIDLGEHDAQPASARPADREAERALQNLGYAASEARRALDTVVRDMKGPIPIETLLREALKVLAP